jgi:Icc-related predicted phosphoesterase
VKTLELVAISDIYGDYKLVKNLLTHLKRRPSTQRIIVVAGDLGLHPDTASYRRDVEQILDACSEFSELVIYVPGDTDSKELNIQKANIFNVNKSYKVTKVGDWTFGFFGLGGAVRDSVREKEPTPYLWEENVPLVRNELTTELKINVQKVMLERPNFAVLITHSPPYGVADLSKPITLNEMLILEEIIAEEEERPDKEEEGGEERVRYTSPRRLGSRLIRDFIKYYQPDLHIFGHVHKQGGKQESINDTLCFNVSHLSPMPYKLTGRKFLTITPRRQGMCFEFENVVQKNLPFSAFLETYL